ncbi:T9SS type A sorting domain-containing protein [Chitinophagaceae bacterium LB-8]|uniref:T9SS type A sorting domain-containing protein n=1 Tax=Paraflavisolibacter caeni TaxID=2982496 RepID=A0A9X3BER6_9BACT|nr:T9SS type A sorting domain-containing protein [Paraflavisolibacter caeni]MCU7547509.1 T9SS type A sorting domain-containing protein [Paraflavisolibacter caeni]
MKPTFLIPSLFLCASLHAQYLKPVVNANFGADAELIANSCKKDSVVASDDWFSDGTNSTITGAGTLIIDTTGAAAMAARYAIDPDFRKLSFYRSMRFPAYSLLLNRQLIDGVFLRDHHGSDSTAFTIGANKNGMSPADWSTPNAQTMSDISDIEDVFVHVRRSGNTSNHHLWLFGGVNIIGTTGNRYFDLEMYQTDISYDHASGKFINYGPDEGHTSWTFDTQGKVSSSGDVIFTLEYSTAALTSLEARIWVNKNDLSITPAAFDWVKDSQGKIVYDSASTSSQYVYAAIKPNTTGNFYSGVQSNAGTWSGPFKFIDASNNVLDNFTGVEFMEFSVNLTKLGLDSTTLWGNSACNFPFKRVLVKSRTSTSFSSELNDFVGPYPFFTVPRVDAQAETSMLCNTNGISKINVLNPYATSIYTWSTPDGNIINETQPTSIYVNKPGMYIVTQQLMNGCGAYARDTITVLNDPSCVVLDVKDIQLKVRLMEGKPLLEWTSAINDKTRYYEVQRSIDGKSYQTIYVQKNSEPGAVQKSYSYLDHKVPMETLKVSYRIKAIMSNEEFISSSILVPLAYSVKLTVYPNPAYQNVNVSIFSEKQQKAVATIVSAAGITVYQQDLSLKQGANVFTLTKNNSWTPGLYIVRITSAEGIQWQKLVIQNDKP